MPDFSIPSPYPRPLIDIGVNLTNSSYQQDCDEVIQRAFTTGLSHLIITGTNIIESQQAITIAQHYPNQLFTTAGIHPHHAKHFDSNSRNQLSQLAQQTPVKAIGECGLDFNRMFSTQEEQIKAFEAQIELAITLQLPLFLHERDAHKTQCEMLHSYRDQLPKAVIHCFTGTKQQAFHYLDLGLSLGMTGWICDERRGQHLHEFIGAIPLDRLMIETDSPYLMPRVKPKPKLASSRRNEPCTLPYVLLEIAKHSSHNIEAIAAATTQNAIDFFQLEGAGRVS
ncbi:MAG: TatD family hydrolase [Spongiibacteraceae bacterium]